MNNENLKKLFMWLCVVFLLMLFIITSSVLKIMIGISLLILLLFINSTERKIKSSIYSRASNETFFDAIKWVAFGIFVIIYPIYLKTNTTFFIITILIFVAVLFILNILKEREYNKN